MKSASFKLTERGRARIDALLLAAAFLAAATLCILAYIKVVPMLLDNPKASAPAMERTRKDGSTPRWSMNDTYSGSTRMRVTIADAALRISAIN